MTNVQLVEMTDDLREVKRKARAQLKLSGTRHNFKTEKAAILETNQNKAKLVFE